MRNFNLNNSLEIRVLTILVLCFFFPGCKVTKEQPGVPANYQPVFNQLHREYVKTPSSNGAKLDTVMKVWSNIEEVSKEIKDTLLIYNEMDFVEGNLIVDVELINEKPPTMDTFLIVKAYLFNPELIDVLFPVLDDSLKAEILLSDDSLKNDEIALINNDLDIIFKSDSLSSVDSIQDVANDSTIIDVENTFRFLSREEIKADSTRDLLDIDNILSDLEKETKLKLNDSILLSQCRSNYFNDSSVLIITDTVVREVFDPSKVVPQLPFDALCKESSEKYVSYEKLEHTDVLHFKVFHKKFEDLFMDMVIVEGGELKLGNNEFDEDERPATPIDVRSFMISKYEVTNRYFIFFLNFMECDTLGQVEGYWIINLDSPDTKIKWDKYSKRFFVMKGYEDYPVVNVTWQGAQMFCKVLKGKLPSEAQWEYAAKGGKYAIRYFTGVDKKDYDYEYRFAGSNFMGECGWFVDNSYGRTHMVGMLKPNQLGIHDMCGNVWEWCYDKYDKDFYKKNNDSHDPEWLEGPPVRSNRGGSWSSDAIYCRITNRNYLSQTECNPYLGFRFMK